MNARLAERLLKAANFPEFQIRKILDGRDTVSDELIVSVVEIKLLPKVETV